MKLGILQFFRPLIGPFLTFYSSFFRTQLDAGLITRTAGVEPLLPLRIIDVVLKWTKQWQQWQQWTWTQSEQCLRGKRQEKPGKKLDLGAFSGQFCWIFSEIFTFFTLFHRFSIDFPPILAGSCWPTSQGSNSWRTVTATQSPP